ncbi:MAG TPA: hypothetical protein PK443_04255 [bacterium]|nr:hypothetical protein [bacterium]
MEFDSIIKQIKRSNPSIILSGPKGVGKKHLVMEIAKTLLGDDAKQIDSGNHPSIIMIKPEIDEKGLRKGKDISIDQIRDDVLNKIVFSSHEKKRRFVIIDQAQRLNESSSNCLLKAVEEPPQDTTFFILTPNLHAMLPTIISRCMVINVPPIDKHKLAKIVNIDKDHELLDYANGSVSALKFYLSIEELLNKLKQLLDSTYRPFDTISTVCTCISEELKGNTKAEELENIEYVFSFIMKHLIKRFENGSIGAEQLASGMKEINKISKKVYLNTQTPLVLENMILELSLRSV